MVLEGKTIKKKKKLVSLYFEFLGKMHLLSQKQLKTIDNYIKELEQKKIENLRNKIK